MPKKTFSGSRIFGKAGRRVIALVFCLLFSVSSFTAVAASESRSVKIIDGKNEVEVTTNVKDPEKIVTEAGFTLDPSDSLDLDSYSQKNGGTITINRAKIVGINDNGTVAYLLGADDSDDNSSVFAKVSDIYDDMRLLIKRAFTVKINVDGKTQKLSVSSGTVKDALDKAGIKIGKDDIVTPSLDTVLTGSDTIKIKRVTYKLRTEKETVKFETQTISDPDMTAGQKEIVTEGVDGQQKVVYLDKYVDGKLDSSEVKKTKVLKESVTQVVKVGTKPAQTLSSYKNSGTPISELEVPSDLKLDKNGIPVNYSKCISGKATAYTGDGITATGIVPKPGYIAVDPKEIPYGTKLYVVSADGKYVYGYCIAADTGGFVKMGNTDIDLFMNNKDMCLDWGNRNVKIYVLD